MTLADQRAQLERRRDAMVALWAQKKISLVEFASGIEALSVSIYILDRAIETINKNAEINDLDAANGGDAAAMSDVDVIMSYKDTVEDC